MASRRISTVKIPTEEGASGDLLRKLREERGWSQQEVAERATQVLYPDSEGKVWQGMISNYERGQIKNPGSAMAQALDTVFELPPGTLFSRVKHRGTGLHLEAATFETPSVAKEGKLAAVPLDSQDMLVEMLIDRFERAIDVLLRSKAGSEPTRVAMLDALFELYEEGVLTKGEVRRRGNLQPEGFYDELRAYRQRRPARTETHRMLLDMEFSSTDDLESDRFPYKVPSTFSEAEGREIERIMENGAPSWVLGVRERLGR